jgi:hypothetical protein
LEITSKNVKNISNMYLSTKVKTLVFVEEEKTSPEKENEEGSITLSA